MKYKPDFDYFTVTTVIWVIFILLSFFGVAARHVVVNNTDIFFIFYIPALLNIFSFLVFGLITGREYRQGITPGEVRVTKYTYYEKNLNIEFLKEDTVYMAKIPESFFHMILNSDRSPAVLYSERESERTRVLDKTGRLLADRDMFPAEVDMAVMHLLREDEGEIPGIRKYDSFQAVCDAVSRAAGQSGKITGHREGSGTTLWEYFKTLELWQGDVLLIPVLIFDRFEKFFTLYPPEDRKIFAGLLGDLVKNRMPDLSESGRIHTENPPNVRIVISIQESFLGRLGEFFCDIPDILRNCFRLPDCDRKKIRCAGCGIPEGLKHVPGCCAERCPFCGNQLASCDCCYTEMEISGYRRLSESEKKQWIGILEEKGRFPYIRYPNVCAKCGRVSPDFFKVADEEWNRYIQPDMQSKILCRDCYEYIRRIIRNGT